MACWLRVAQYSGSLPIVSDVVAIGGIEGFGPIIIRGLATSTKSRSITGPWNRRKLWNFTATDPQPSEWPLSLRIVS